MSVADVEQAIRAVIETHDRYAGWLSMDQTRVRCAMIDPILWALGWPTWIPSECQTNVRLGRGGYLDYVLFDPHGEMEIVISIATPKRQRQYDRQLMARRLIALTGGVAVLTDGPHWEIYDLSLPSRGLASKIVENLVLDSSIPDEIETAAIALDY